MDEQQIITLPEDCGGHWPCSAHDAFLRRAAGGGRVRLEARNVRRIGTPAVQLVLALARALEGQGGALSIATASPAFAEAFADLGLAGAFTALSVPQPREAAHG